MEPLALRRTLVEETMKIRIRTIIAATLTAIAVTTVAAGGNALAKGLSGPHVGRTSPVLTPSSGSQGVPVQRDPFGYHGGHSRHRCIFAIKFREDLKACG
jgi:hypothetical protein